MTSFPWPAASRALTTLAAFLVLALAAGCALQAPGAPADEDPPDVAAQDRGAPPPGPPSYRTPPPSPRPPAIVTAVPDRFDAYGVSAGHPDAVEVGMQVLEDGGNAVDAAVATAYAVSVVEPFASGIGGGGAALVVEADGEPVMHDYRDAAPQSGQVPATNTGIPGFVAGMEQLHASHGSVDLAALIEPAAALAGDGAEASAMLAERLAVSAGGLPVGELAHFFPGGAAAQAGETIVQEELARTLMAIADGGAEAFYEGDLAGQLADRADGVDRESLRAYEARQLAPVSGAFAGYEVLSAAPPLSGATLVQILQVAQALGVENYDPGSADFVHAVAMAWRLADRFRDEDLGDPDFVDVPTGELTDPERNAALAEQIPMDALLPLDPSQPYDGLETDTTHLTVVDADGMVVSMTNTLSNLWGSRQYALGFFLNDQMRNFDAGDPRNAPEPGKRTVANSTPTILVDDEGRPVLALGSPGGRRIPHVLAQTLLRWGLHGESLEDAVSAPRFHHEGTVLEIEERPPADVADDLLGRGHSGFEQPAFPYYFGSVQALEIDYDAGEVRGATDPRREGDWRAGSF